MFFGGEDCWCSNLRSSLELSGAGCGERPDTLRTLYMSHNKGDVLSLPPPFG
jgi:hypothetical protein